MRYLLVFFLIALIGSCGKRQAPLLHPGLKGKVKQVTEYYYDNEQAFKTKQQSGKQITFFDNEGRTLSETRTDGKIVMKTVFKNGKDEIVDTSFMNDTIAGIEKQALDKNGWLVRQTVQTGDPKNPSPYSSFTSYTLFKYDEKGKRLEADNYEGKKIASKISYHYDDKDEVVEEDMTAYGPTSTETSKTLYAYDAAGNQIKQTAYDAAGKFIYADSLSYSNFDREGNWLLSVSSSSDDAGGIPKSDNGKTIVVRKIEYFK